MFGGRHYDANFQFSQFDDTWTWDGTNWTEQHPATHPSARFFTIMAYDPALNKAILFGGITCPQQCTYLNDTWAWDGTNWTQITTPVSPPARIGASLAYDATSQQFVLFGGNYVDSGGVRHFLSDTWLFDGTNWTQATPLTSPSPRSGDSNRLTYVPANNGLLMFGGYDGNPRNDTWLWDGSNWNALAPATSPGPSEDPAITYDSTTATAVLYLFESQTWTWNGVTWTRSTSISPQSRFGPVFVYDPPANKVLMFAGVNCLPGFEDEWLWDGAAWTPVDLGERFPPQRSLFSGQIAFDTARNQAVLFSGSREGCSLLYDTWTWNGTVWNQIHPATSPPPRVYSSMAYDPDQGVTVLFGGRITPSTQGNDTWVFDGVTWTRQAPAQSPGQREGTGMAFDRVSHKIVLFGGVQIGGSPLNETWTWDGSTWTQEHPSTSPPGRSYLNMSPDAQGRPVVFGGEICTGGPCTYPNDTWRWNGTSHNWEQVTPGGSIPPGRFGAGMGYDAASQSIIFFGGQDNNQVYGDTWAFDGSNWQALSPSQSPSPRVFTALSDGSVTNPPVLMGGGANIGPGGADAWTWGVPGPPPSTTPTVSPTSTAPAGGTATATPSSTVTPPPLPTGSPTSTAIATPPPVSTVTATATSTAPAGGTATATPSSTVTPPPLPTNTVPPSPTNTPCTSSFSDVHPADYFATPVQYLACHGVISGYADGTFRPYANTTRSQMVKIVVLGFAKPITTPAGGGNTFHDVPPAFPFDPYIETAAALNIVSGYTCGGPGEPCDGSNRPYFRPFANVTRGQLAKIDAIAAGWALLNPPARTFADVLPSSAFYAFVETAACHGVISGYTCGGVGESCDGQNRPYFRQGNPATRGQITKIVYLSILAPAACGP